MTSDPFSFRQGAMGGMRSSDVMGNIGEIPAHPTFFKGDRIAAPGKREPQPGCRLE